MRDEKGEAELPHILILNGPNLNRLGKREPDVYGTDTLTDLEQRLFQFAEGIQTELTFFQSNHEGDLIDALHEAEEQYDGIVLNPGAFSHYSYALRDAVAAISIPVIEGSSFKSSCKGRVPAPLGHRSGCKRPDHRTRL